MSKLNLCTDNIENFLQEVESVITLVNKVNALSNQFNVPSDFPKLNLLRSVQTDLTMSSNNLNRVNDWVKNSVKEYDSIILALHKQSYSLPSNFVKIKDFNL